MKKKIYLDNAATTQTDKRVLKAMKPFFTKEYGNPSSLHSFGRKAKEALEKSRAVVAKHLNASPNEIVFTSSGTESDNLALKGTAYALKEKGSHIVTTKIEHHAVLHTAEQLEKEGFNVTFVPVSGEGIVDPKEIENAITHETILVSVMHANNEIGTIQPIAETGKICRKKGITFHTDAVQTVGKLPVDVEKLNVDLLSAAAHKFYGPKGAGFLYVRKGSPLRPLMVGGGHEKNRRSGTENVAGAVGLAKALDMSVNEMKKQSEKELRLREKIIDGILGSIEGVKVNGSREKRLPGNVNVSFDFIEGESLITHLDFKGIAASTGSACSVSSLEPSHVLLALGLSHVQAHGSLRLTIGRFNSETEIDYVLKVLPPIVKKLRAISPLNRENIGEIESMVSHGHGHSH